MISNQQYENLQRDELRMGSQEESQNAVIDSALKGLHTCLPGIIVSFDSAKQTAQVQPAIKRVFTSRGPVNLPVCVDVPVHFPGGGGYFITFPVAAGDECILLFSERAIDNWYLLGGTQEPAEYRLHDLSDGIALVGLNSQPNILNSFNMAALELRSRSGTAFIRITGTAVSIIAPGGLNITGPVTMNGHRVDETHTHKGVQTGSGTSGVVAT